MPTAICSSSCRPIWMFRDRWAALIPGFDMPPKGSKRTAPAAEDGACAKKKKIASKAPPDDVPSLKRSLSTANVASMVKAPPDDGPSLKKLVSKDKVASKAKGKGKAKAKAKSKAAGYGAEETQAGV